MNKFKLLMVVDMQNDFVNGSLGSEEARKIVPNVVEEIRHFAGQGFPVIATMDTHDENYLATHEGIFLPVKHCIAGTPGHRLIPELEELIPPECRFKKSTFGAANLLQKMRDCNLRFRDKSCAVHRLYSIELIGVCTDICVVSNALMLRSLCPEISITVKRSCCAASKPSLQDAALAVMESCHIHVI